MRNSGLQAEARSIFGALEASALACSRAQRRHVELKHDQPPQPAPAVKTMMTMMMMKNITVMWKRSHDDDPETAKHLTARHSDTFYPAAHGWPQVEGWPCSQAIRPNHLQLAILDDIVSNVPPSRRACQTNSQKRARTPLFFLLQKLASDKPRLRMCAFRFPMARRHHRRNFATLRLTDYSF